MEGREFQHQNTDQSTCARSENVHTLADVAPSAAAHVAALVAPDATSQTDLLTTSSAATSSATDKKKVSTKTGNKRKGNQVVDDDGAGHTVKAIEEGIVKKMEEGMKTMKQEMNTMQEGTKHLVTIMSNKDNEMGKLRKELNTAMEKLKRYEDAYKQNES